VKRVAIVLALLGLAAAIRADDIPAERQAVLMNMLRQDCGSCHGMTLKGGLGPPLLPESLAGKPNAVLADTILNGRPGTAMPPWRDFLSLTETAWLVKQLRGNPR
jgi:cytochrome c55X